MDSDQETGSPLVFLRKLKALSGAVVPYAGNDVLGTATHFTADVGIGDEIVVLDTNGNELYGRVAVIVSDTHLIIG